MRSSPKASRLRKGFTLIELLVVVTVIAILASMLMPLIGIIKELANQTKCASNISQMVGACEAYRSSEEVPWAVPWLNIQGYVAPASLTVSNADTYTFQVMEVFAAAENLTGALFKCPSASIGPNGRPQMPDGANFWLTNGGALGTPLRIPYAMDWAAPGDSGSDRVVIADRDPKNHKGSLAMAAYADSHTKKLNVLCASSGNKTFGQVTGASFNTGIANPDTIGQPVDPVAFAASAGTATPDKTPDNIYDDNLDMAVGATATVPPESLVSGGGEAHRVWVK